MEGAEGHMEALESCSFFAFKTCAQDWDQKSADTGVLQTRPGGTFLEPCIWPKIMQFFVDSYPSQIHSMCVLRRIINAIFFYICDASFKVKSSST
jgi:hypothetical protein